MNMNEMKSLLAECMMTSDAYLLRIKELEEKLRIAESKMSTNSDVYKTNQDGTISSIGSNGTFHIFPENKSQFLSGNLTTSGTITCSTITAPVINVTAPIRTGPVDWCSYGAVYWTLTE